MDRPLALDLVGRTGELAILREAVAAARTGAGTFVALTGEAGLGKTALLDEIARVAGAETEIVRLRGDQLLADVPFDAVSAGLGVRWKQVVSTAGAGGTAMSEPVLIEAIVQDVADVSLTSTVVILIDDLQWMDQPSVRVIAGLARRAEQHSMVIVAASRPTDRPDLGHLLQRARPVALSPLAEPAARTLIERHLHGSPADAEEILHRAVGSPFWIQRLCAFANDVDGAGGGAPRLDLVVLSPLRVLGIGGIRILAVAALCGARIDVRRVADVLDEPPETVERVLREAEGLGAITSIPDWRFTHDLVRETLVHDLPTETRDLVYRTLGRDLEQTDPHTAVGYLSQLSDTDAHVGEVLLRAAASSAMSTIVEAASLAERGWKLLPDGHQWRLPAIGDVVGLLALAGRANDAYAIGGDVLDEDLEPTAQARLRVALCAAAEHANRSADALVVIEPALRLGGLAPEVAALVHAWAGRAWLWTGDLDEAEAACAQASEVAGSHDSIVSATRSLIAAARGYAADAVAIARRSAGETYVPSMPADGHILPDTFHDPYGVRVIFAARLLDVDDMAQSQAEFEAVLAGDGLLPLSRHTTCLLGIAAMHYLCGDLASALVKGHEAVAVAADTGTTLGFPLVSGLEAYIALEAGDLAGARAACDEGWSNAMLPGTNAGIDVLLKVDMLVSEIDGTSEDSLARLELLWAMAAPMAYLAAWRTMAPTAVRIAAARGHHLAGPLAEHARIGAERGCESPSAEATGLRCLGLASSDPDLLARAAAAYGRTPRAMDEMECRIECAEMLLATDDKLGARTHLHRALVLSRELQLAGSEQRITAILRRVGVRERRAVRDATLGWNALTVTEERVVELVAEGLTNREVGGRLHMGARTVETHLSHVFTKLDVRSRVELARAYATRDQ